MARGDTSHTCDPGYELRRYDYISDGAGEKKANNCISWNGQNNIYVVRVLEVGIRMLCGFIGHRAISCGDVCRTLVAHVRMKQQVSWREATAVSVVLRFRRRQLRR